MAWCLLASCLTFGFAREELGGTMWGTTNLQYISCFMDAVNLVPEIHLDPCCDFRSNYSLYSLICEDPGACNFIFKKVPLVCFTFSLAMSAVHCSDIGVVKSFYCLPQMSTRVILQPFV